MLFSTHKFAHCDLNFANSFEITSAISIDHDKLEILHLLEEVGDCERILKIWVELISDLFSLANFGPLVVSFLVEDALGVGLAERVQVLELAAGYEKVHLHLQAGALCLYHIYFFN